MNFGFLDPPLLSMMVSSLVGIFLEPPGASLPTNHTSIYYSGSNTNWNTSLTRKEGEVQGEKFKKTANFFSIFMGPNLGFESGIFNA